MTYVRMTTVQADPSKIEEGLRFVREQGQATMRAQPGFEGLQVLIDRTSGKVISLSQWESEAAAQVAGSALSQTRAQAAQLTGATAPASSDIFELAVNESASQTAAARA